MLARIAYAGGVFAMEVLSTKTATLIDMYRLTMLEQFGLRAKTVGEQVELFTDLGGFFKQAFELKKTQELIQPKKPDAGGDKKPDGGEPSEGDEERNG